MIHCATPLSGAWSAWTMSHPTHCSCSLPCALVCGYVCMGKACACLRGSGACVLCRARSCAVSRIWVRIALVFVVWCPCSLLCALVCGYGFLGKDCACLSVVLVLIAIARVGSGYVFLAGIALVSPWFLRSCVKGVHMPVVVLDRCPVLTCRKLRRPARSGRDVSV